MTSPLSPRGDKHPDKLTGCPEAGDGALERRKGKLKGQKIKVP